MDGELSLELLAQKLDSTLKIASTLKADMDEMKKNHEGQTDEDKEKEAKHAQEKMEEEKKEARANRYKALKEAMGEHDEMKRDSAIKAAMDEHDHKEKDAQSKDPSENVTNSEKPHIEKEGQTDEEKEEHAAVASILKEKKADYISKILTANKIFNPTEVKAIQKRLKTANISELEKEWSHVKPFVASMPNVPKEQSQDFIPFFASMGNAEEIDAAQLNANSPDSAFAKLSTKELLEMAN